MQNDYVAPVDHGALSTIGSVGVGAAGGAAKTFGKTVLWTAVAMMTVGFLAASGAFGLGIFAAIEGFSVGYGVLGAVAGGLLAIPVGSLLGGISSVFGAGKGALDAKDRVSMEKGAARTMEMQLAAYQSMAAQKSYNLPAQGSPMNQAMPSIDGASIDHQGLMAGQQRVRA
jgi:hypothetical protein